MEGTHIFTPANVFDTAVEITVSEFEGWYKQPLKLQSGKSASENSASENSTSEISASETSISVASNSEEKAPNVLEQFAHSFIYSGIEAPINGATQLVNELSGHEIIGELKLVGAPEAAPEDSIERTVQLVGSALGTAIPFLITYEALGKLGKLSHTVPLYQNTIMRNAAAGGIMGGVFKPVSRLNEENWRSSRLTNAIVDGGTFGALSFFSKGLGSLSSRFAPSLGLSAESSTVRALATPAIAGVPRHLAIIGLNVAAAIPAGATGAQLDSILNKERFATFDEMKDAAIEYGTIAAVLGGVHALTPKLPGLPREKSIAAETKHVESAEVKPLESAEVRPREREIVDEQKVLRDSLRLPTTEGGTAQNLEAELSPTQDVVIEAPGSPAATQALPLESTAQATEALLPPDQTASHPTEPPSPTESTAQPTESPSSPLIPETVSERNLDLANFALHNFPKGIMLRDGNLAGGTVHLIRSEPGVVRYARTDGKGIFGEGTPEEIEVEYGKIRNNRYNRPTSIEDSHVGNLTVRETSDQVDTNVYRNELGLLGPGSATTVVVYKDGGAAFEKSSEPMKIKIGGSEAEVTNIAHTPHSVAYGNENGLFGPSSEKSIRYSKIEGENRSILEEGEFHFGENELTNLVRKAPMFETYQIEDVSFHHSDHGVGGFSNNEVQIEVVVKDTKNNTFKRILSEDEVVNIFREQLNSGGDARNLTGSLRVYPQYDYNSSNIYTGNFRYTQTLTGSIEDLPILGRSQTKSVLFDPQT